MKYTVPYYLCDDKKRIRIDGILKMITEASVTNTEKIEKGMNPNLWVIYRWQINFFKEINWKDEIEIETFTRQVHSFYAFRIFNVYRNGEKVLEAETKWFLISKDTRRPMKIPVDLKAAYGEREGYMYDGDEIKEKDSYDHRLKIQIKKADIDLNGHVNNTVYLEYAKEGNDLDKEEVKNLQIVYKKEVRYDEDLYLEYSNTSDAYYFALKSEDQLKAIGELKYS